MGKKNNGYNNHSKNYNAANGVNNGNLAVVEDNGNSFVGSDIDADSEIGGGNGDVGDIVNDSVSSIVSDDADDTETDSSAGSANSDTSTDNKQAKSPKQNILDILHEEILNSELPEDEKNRRLSALLRASNRQVNLMLVGTTGAGKSSTINALFDMSVAKVGVGVDPETKKIVKYDLGNLTIWDTPGLGDGVKADKAHIKKIVKKLSELDADGNLLIDLVMVVVDASSKDLAVSYNVINDTLIPCLGKDNAHRILIGLNQSDMAMKGRHWDCEQNAPDSVLSEFLTKKAESVKQRVFDATGVTVEPVCYSAGYTEDSGEQQRPYNLSKLLYYILMAVPAEKRLIIVDNLNDEEENWESNDDEVDYTAAVKESFFGSLLASIGVGADSGSSVGDAIIGIPGVIIGGLIGGIIGGIRALFGKPVV